MHEERQATSLDVGIEACRSNEFDNIGMHLMGDPHLDHAHKAPQIPDLGVSAREYASDFNITNGHDYWHPLNRSYSIYQESRAHSIFDSLSAKRPDRSHTWSSESTDSGYGSQFGSGTTPSMSVSNHLDPGTEISSPPEDCSSHTKGLTRLRQTRIKSIEDNKLRCNKCPWVGKTPSEKRKHDARHRKDHRCEEDGCGARFGARNDLERHRKSVHNKCPECGPVETYKCFGANCGHPEKVWPRLDNFKVHLRLKHSDQAEKDLLAQSRAWYYKEQKKEEAKRTEEMLHSLASRIDLKSRKELPATPNEDTVKTISPSKTLIRSELINPSDYSDAELGNLSLHPIEHPQSLRAITSPEKLQTLNELPFSTLKADGSLAVQVDIKLPSVPDILADAAPQRSDDRVIRMRPESSPSKGRLPGVESFDHVVASPKVLNLAAKLQHDMSGLSHEERNICLEIASNWKAKRTQDISQSEEDPFVKGVLEVTEKVYGMTKEGPKQEGFACPFCPKYFNRPSALKKHQKRHEKPYGCTFAGCYGRFGSKADWKRHESMQHCLTQSFRCSLPREPHLQCAKLFLQQKDFVEHLNTVHHAELGTIERQIANSRIGANDAESKFRYWCGFCKEIKTVGKKGVAAQNERFNHIDLHFRKGENIKRWIPAKGHTEKGAQKRRDKNRRKESKRTITSRLENPELLYNIGHDGGELSIYEECPSSADETYTDAKPHPDSPGERKRARTSDYVEKKEVEVFFCCECKDGPQLMMTEGCIQCCHRRCPYCPKEVPGSGAPFNS